MLGFLSMKYSTGEELQTIGNAGYQTENSRIVSMLLDFQKFHFLHQLDWLFFNASFPSTKGKAALEAYTQFYNLTLPTNYTSIQK